MPITAAMVNDAWQQTMKVMPWPGNYFLDWFSGIRKTYRERLDEQPVNYWGEPIPRIEIVKRNLLIHRMGRRAKTSPTR